MTFHIRLIAAFKSLALLSLTSASILFIPASWLYNFSSSLLDQHVLQKGFEVLPRQDVYYSIVLMCLFLISLILIFAAIKSYKENKYIEIDKKFIRGVQGSLLFEIGSIFLVCYPIDLIVRAGIINVGFIMFYTFYSLYWFIICFAIIHGFIRGYKGNLPLFKKFN